ncbi:winged helix-turn-helix domain-containing protein [Rhizobium rhizogenes]|uniref:winged helix-turn-helix domain-containing protein n=1 Tax=Rhizobium rhizogenes TaxID=359 RepID=UPI0015725853|nr:winged helix-turn-helix domain-containing protein [Rhizobium rhizogenes]NTG94211.1 winged helix-turn-helix domain-containing protein [Rhizobium rhizogenes]
MTKATALFLTEAQLAERMGITTDVLKTALPALMQAGFPIPDPLFANRRYWPACEAFLDRRYGLAAALGQGIPALDGEEKW